MIENERLSCTLRRICLVGDAASNRDVLDAAKLFNVDVVTSETGIEFCQGDQEGWLTWFCLSEFEGAIFDNIHKSGVKHK